MKKIENNRTDKQRNGRTVLIDMEYIENNRTNEKTGRGKHDLESCCVSGQSMSESKNMIPPNNERSTSFPNVARKNRSLLSHTSFIFSHT